MTEHGRRSPGPRDRQRDADRTRQLLTEAAVVEFSAHGFSGSRVGDIAARAGVNKQLISYYFGGKRGLYEAISEQWRRDEREMVAADAPFPEVAAAYARQNLVDPDLTRLLVREGLDGAPADDAAQRERFRQFRDDLARRRDAGELASGVDPGELGLAVFALAAAPVTFPHVARALGVDPDDDGAADRWADAVARLVGLLCEPPVPEEPS